MAFPQDIKQTEGRGLLPVSEAGGGDVRQNCGVHIDSIRPFKEPSVGLGRSHRLILQLLEANGPPGCAGRINLGKQVVQQDLSIRTDLVQDVLGEAIVLPHRLDPDQVPLVDGAELVHVVPHSV